MKKIILTESQIDLVLETLLFESKLGDKAWGIVQKFYPELTEPRESRSGQQFQPILTKTHVEHIANTLNQYQAYSTHALNWLLLLMLNHRNGMANGAMQIYEDLDLYASYIRKFEENKQKIIAAGDKPDLWSQSGNQKILNYKNKEELYDVIKSHLKAKDADKGDMMYPKVKHYVETGDFEFIGETDVWYIVKIINGHEDAVIDIQRGPSPEDAKEYTKWCTRVAGTYFNNYMKESPLFMLINKQTAKTTNRVTDPKSMLQFHWGRSLQFRDREDRAYNSDGNAASLTDFFNDYPDVYPIFFQGVIDVITSSDLTPYFPINIDKTSLPANLKAYYKYKIERAVKPEISKIFKITEDDVIMIEYGKNGIVFDVKHGKKYDPILNKTTPKMETFVLMPETTTKTFFEGITFTASGLDKIGGFLEVENPVTWIPYMDIEKLPKVLKEFSNETTAEELNDEQTNFIFELRKLLIAGNPVVDIMRKIKDYSNKESQNNTSTQTILDVLRYSDLFNRSKIVDAMTNPANDMLGIRIIDSDIYLDVYDKPENFSEIGLNLENFKQNSTRQKMNTVKTNKSK